jgi:hypothetical protein
MRQWHLKSISSVIDTFIKDPSTIPSRKELHIIGRECLILEEKFPVFLEKIKVELPSDDPLMVAMAVDKLLTLWKLWIPVASHIRRIHPSEEDVSRCDTDCQRFITFFAENFQTQKFTTYMHFVQDHLADCLRIYYNEFGFGYGVLSTQGLEHLNGDIKQEFLSTWKGPLSFQQIMIHQYQDPVLKEAAPSKSQRKQTHHCSLCHSPHHKRTTCPRRVGANSNPEQRASSQMETLPASSMETCLVLFLYCLLFGR